MPSSFGIVASFLAVLSAVSYPLFLKPTFTTWGLFRDPEPLANTQCTKIEGLQACEKIVLHTPSGLLYLACSTPEARVAYVPFWSEFNVTGAGNDYVATYDSKTGNIKRLRFEGFTSDRGYTAHGMDVVTSKDDPETLFVYLVNHRPPPAGHDIKEIGADSVIEIFRTTLGSDVLTHVKTVQDPAILTPNDIVGAADGQSFFVTNDHSSKTGWKRWYEENTFRPVTTVTYCHTTTGCKIAASGLVTANGITRAKDGKIFVVNATGGSVYVLEEDADHELVLLDEIKFDRSLDNAFTGEDGAIYIPGYVKVIVFGTQHRFNPSIQSPSSVFRITLNEGESAYYGEKYKVEKIFEDDGNLASGITSAVIDLDGQKTLYLHGLYASWLLKCQL
jgi:hypothetical protein